MTNIDQFESVFKAADKPAFSHEAIEIRNVLVVTDMDADQSREFEQQARTFLSVLTDDNHRSEWNSVGKADFSDVGQLLEQVEKQSPQLVCTYRNLFIPASAYPYSLGVYVDVLTQASNCAVMLLPHPNAKTTRETANRGTKEVMAITDHLAGDHHLVSFAAGFTEPDGTLLLTHVEDEQTFGRYMNTISKIPAIDTETAREEILQQLLKEPSDYIRSCRDVLEAEGLPLEVNEIVTVGHQLADYKRLVEEHQVDLVVMNTKDEDQLAMHGLAYPLSVELRETPLLLL